jgi:glycosyltransferase involved in cell wall biosynthesis
MSQPEHKPKVAIFSSRFLPYSQTFVYDQVRHHQRYAAEVFARERLNAGQFPFAAVHHLTDRGWAGALEAALYRTTLLSPTFFRKLRDGGFSLIHGHFGAAACYALPYAALLNLPLVVTFHGHDAALLASRDRLLPANWGYWGLSKWLFRRANLLLAVSEDLASLLIGVGAPPSRVRVHRLGVDTTLPQRIDRGDDRVIVVMVGRFVEKKGFEYGIRAFAAVAKSFPRAVLRIVGDGHLEGRYRELIHGLGVGAQVELLPPMPHGEVLRTMQAADVILVPSVEARDGDREGGPLVIREASVMGLAVIATRHAAIPEVVEHDVTGLLVRERDVDGTAEALRLLLSSPAYRSRLGNAARGHVCRVFNHGERMAALERHYGEVLAAHDGRSRSRRHGSARAG